MNPQVPTQTSAPPTPPKKNIINKKIILIISGILLLLLIILVLVFLKLKTSSSPATFSSTDRPSSAPNASQSGNTYLIDNLSTQKTNQLVKGAILKGQSSPGAKIVLKINPGIENISLTASQTGSWQYPLSSTIPSGNYQLAIFDLGTDPKHLAFPISIGNNSSLTFNFFNKSNVLGVSNSPEESLTIYDDTNPHSLTPDVNIGENQVAIVSNNSRFIDFNSSLLEQYFADAAANAGIPVEFLAAIGKQESRVTEYNDNEVTKYTTPNWWTGKVDSAPTQTGNDPDIQSGYGFNTCLYIVCFSGADVRGGMQIEQQTFQSILNQLPPGTTHDKRILKDSIFASALIDKDHIRYINSNQQPTNNDWNEFVVRALARAYCAGPAAINDPSRINDPSCGNGVYDQNVWRFYQEFRQRHSDAGDGTVPQNLRATLFDGNKTVRLDWQRVSTPNIVYVIFYETAGSPGNFQQVVVNTTNNTIDLRGLPTGQYRFHINACTDPQNTSTCSAPSNATAWLNIQ